MEWLYQYEVHFFMPVHVLELQKIKKAFQQRPELERFLIRFEKIRSYVLRRYIFHYKSIVLRALMAKVLTMKQTGNLSSLKLKTRKSLRLITFRKKKRKNTKEIPVKRTQTSSFQRNLGIADLVQTGLKESFIGFLFDSQILKREPRMQLNFTTTIRSFRSSSLVSNPNSPFKNVNLPSISFLKMQTLFRRKFSRLIQAKLSKKGRGLGILMGHSSTNDNVLRDFRTSSLDVLTSVFWEMFTFVSKESEKPEKMRKIKRKKPRVSPNHNPFGSFHGDSRDGYTNAMHHLMTQTHYMGQVENL